MLVVKWCLELTDPLSIEQDDAYARKEEQKETFYFLEICYSASIYPR